jgi:hypothetical protein
MATAFAALALFGAWIATESSSFLWARLPMLQYLAFPWRALLLPALFLPLLAAPAFDRLGRRAALAAVALLVVANVAHTEPKGYLVFDDEYYAPASIAARGINTTTREEYEPRWVEKRPPFVQPMLSSRGKPIEVREVTITTAKQELLLRVPAATEVETRTFYYPGWRVAVDGGEVAVAPVAGRGTMSFTLPAGEHRVTIELGATPARRAGAAITLAAAGLIAAALAVGRRTRGGLRPA